MLIDHIGLILLPQYVFLRWIGRIAFPIFAYMLGQGMLHTRNYKNYLFRLVLFAIIFQKPYCYCTNLTDINIFGELALGLIAIYAYEQLFKQQRPLLAWLPALIFGIMAQLWNFQYGLYGITLLITGYVFADQQWKLSAAWL
ncbi:MAG: TraX family protein, partial [Clostridiales bacterium]